MVSTLRCLVCTVLLLFWQSAQAGVSSGCDALADAREAGLPGPAPGTPQVTCAGFFPFAVAVDGSESTRLEVVISGAGITAASLGNSFAVVGVSVDGAALPQTGGFIELFDDGSNGDRAAGDGIWSRSGIRIDAPPVPPIFFYQFDQLRVTDGSGTRDIFVGSPASTGQYGPALLGRLAPELRATARDRGAGFSVTDHVAFLRSPDVHAELRWLLRAQNPPANIRSVPQRFYTEFEDDFDFIFLWPTAHVPGGLRGAYLSASNDVSGIGRSISDDTADWGSDGRLQGVLTMNLSDGGPVIHELTHRWGIFVGTDIGLQQCSGAHVGVAGVGCGPLGGFEPNSLVDNGDGTYTVNNTCFSAGGAAADTTALNPLNLYLAGLIPATDVPPFPVPVNVDCNSISQNFSAGTVTFAADDMVTRTIDDIIDLEGPRVPDSTASQRDFTAAWFVLSHRDLTPTEMGWFQYRAEYLGRQAAGDQPLRLTFFEATGDRATLDTRITDPLVLPPLVFADGFESP